LDEREGLYICYRLADPAVARLWLQLRAVAEQQLAEVERALDAYRRQRHEFTLTLKVGKQYNRHSNNG
jgi:hypothetical protein